MNFKKKNANSAGENIALIFQNLYLIVFITPLLGVVILSFIPEQRLYFFLSCCFTFANLIFMKNVLVVFK
jgi:hypothetical protein